MKEEEIFAGAFSDQEESAPVAEAETPAPEQPAPEPAPEPEPGPEPQPETPDPEPQAPSAPEPKAEVQPAHVPVTALLDERDKRQTAERELQRLRAEQQAPEIPDRYQDPEGYEAHRDVQFQQQLLNHNLNVSERFARKEYGPETVETARQWALQKFQADPHYYARVMSDPDPYELVVTDYKREQVFSAMKSPADLDAFLAWQAASQQAQAPASSAAPAASPNSPVKRPPPSLAGAPSAGGISMVGDEDAFDAEFKKKA